jgi:hypothetical protein
MNWPKRTTCIEIVPLKKKQKYVYHPDSMAVVLAASDSGGLAVGKFCRQEI